MLKQESITFHNQNQYEIELDCIAVKVEYEPWEAIEKISSIIWDNSPLLGELIMGAEEINELLSAGMHIFKKIMSNPHAMLTRMEQQLLIHSCVVLTQEQERETSDGKLWDYILERLGYDKTKNHYSWQSIYKSLADQIEEGFQSRKKVFSDGGHKYYNSLRLHALAPSWTLENLINILYHFYEKNLEYQYIESDNSYHIFVDQIAKRWSGTNQCEKELKLRSDHIAASFRTLFVYRPQYMAAICDALTFRINEILKGERDLFNDNNRWDVAVIQWYQKKTEKERQKMEQATKRAYRERVVIHADEIHPSYYLEGEKLFVQLPRIRLPEITERPIVRLYQGDREIASQRLSVFGDELCLTTREHSFCISDLQNINWELPLHFSISLQCAGLLLYDSKHELYRDYLLFLDSGKETKKIHSNVTRQYFFTNDSMNIEIYDEAVLGTELFEQLPDEIIKEPVKQMKKDEPVSDVFGIFAAPQEPQQLKEHRMRQFLCFSDSRSEAAFFANYMEKSYQEFLRRRAILQVAEQLKAQGQTEITVPGFVLKLTRFFDEKKTFHIWRPDDKIDKGELHALSESNAWIAVLNEMFNARRGTSLASLGLLSFEYQPNEKFVESIANRYQIKVSESRDLLNQIAMDAVFMGTVNAGKSLTLNDAEREYIFFTPYEKRLVLQKTSDIKSSVQGWAGRKRDNTGNYYPNARMQRLIRALGMTQKEADEFLEAYWFGVFRPESSEYILSAEDFSIRFLGNSQLQFYQCEKCGNITSYNVKNYCASVRCDGTLKLVDPLVLFNPYL